MKRLIALLLFLPFISYSQKFQFGKPLIDTAHVSNMSVAGEAKYDTLPSVLKETSFTPFHTLNTYYDSVSQFPIKQAGFSYLGKIYGQPAISKGDSVIREIGNIYRVADSFVCTYSKYKAPYADNNVYVYLASSRNGITWTDRGRIIVDSSAEDPYLVKLGSNFLLYVEHKQEVPFKRIAVYISSNLSNFTFGGYAVSPDANPYSSTDVSSPLAWVENGLVYLVYEARGSSTQGCICLASSTDGINFTKYGNNPIVSGSDLSGSIKWATHIVPHEIVEIDGLKHLFLRGWTGMDFASGVVVSDSSFYKWTDLLGSYMSGFGNKSVEFMPYVNNGALYANLIYNDEIYTGLFTQNPSPTMAQGTTDLGNTIYRITNSHKTESREYEVTTNRTVNIDLYGDTVYGAGYLKYLNNPTSFTITVTPQSGVTINGSTSSVTIPQNSTLILRTVSSNAYRTLNFKDLPANGYIQGGQSLTNAAFFQTTTLSGATAGFGAWVTNNAFFDGTNWKQPRGTAVNSFLFGVTHHNEFTWRYAVANGTSGATITPTEVAHLSSTGNFSVNGTLTAKGIVNDATADSFVSVVNGEFRRFATAPISMGGTGLNGLGTANQIFGVNSGGTGNEYKTLTNTNTITWSYATGIVRANADTSASGLVTQFDLTTALNTNTAPFLSTSALTLNISLAYRAYVFGGTISTWTLPTVAAGSGYLFFIINKGSGILTINSNAGGSDIWDAGSTLTTKALAPGETARIFCDGVNYMFSN